MLKLAFKELGLGSIAVVWLLKYSEQAVVGACEHWHSQGRDILWRSEGNHYQTFMAHMGHADASFEAQSFQLG